METTKRILDRAIELTRAHGLCKFALAADAQGNEVRYLSKSAECFCTMGFISRAADDVGFSYMEASAVIKQVRPVMPSEFRHDITGWTARPERKIEDLTDLFERARATL